MVIIEITTKRKNWKIFACIFDIINLYAQIICPLQSRRWRGSSSSQRALQSSPIPVLALIVPRSFVVELELNPRISHIGDGEGEG